MVGLKSWLKSMSAMCQLADSPVFVTWLGEAMSAPSPLATLSKLVSAKFSRLEGVKNDASAPFSCSSDSWRRDRVPFLATLADFAM